MARETYYYDNLEKELGIVEGSQGELIYNWTPNNIKTIIMGVSFIIIEYHVPVNNRLFRFNRLKSQEVFNQLGNWRDPLIVLKQKAFSCLEEIIIDSELVPYMNQEIIDETRLNTQSRLRAVSEIGFGNTDPANLVSHLREIRNENPLEILSKGLYSKGKINKKGIRVQLVDNPNYYEKFLLRPKIYERDNERGALAVRLNAIKDMLTVQEEKRKNEDEIRKLVEDLVNKDLKESQSLRNVIKCLRMITKRIKEDGYVLSENEKKVLTMLRYLIIEGFGNNKGVRIGRIVNDGLMQGKYGADGKSVLSEIYKPGKFLEGGNVVIPQNRAYAGNAPLGFIPLIRVYNNDEKRKKLYKAIRSLEQREFINNETGENKKKEDILAALSHKSESVNKIGDIIEDIYKLCIYGLKATNKEVDGLWEEPEVVEVVNEIKDEDNKIEDFEEVENKEEGVEDIEGQEDDIKLSKNEVNERVEKAFKVHAEMIGGTIDEIIDNYTKMFASGYEVIKPYGVMTEGSEGLGTTYSLSGSRLKDWEVGDRRHFKLKSEDDSVDITITNAWKLLQEKMSLTIRNERSYDEIAHIVVNGYKMGDKSKSRIDGKLYFPKKMLEFAYGLEAPDGNLNADTDFTKHSNASSWKKYANSEVKKSIEKILKAIVKQIVLNNKDSKLNSDEIKESIKKYCNKIKVALCTCVLVSKLDKVSNRLAEIKIRVLDPYGTVGDENIAEIAAVEAAGGHKGSGAIADPVQNDGWFYEFRYEANHILSNAEPIFAYKALDSLLMQGERPSWDNIIFGLDQNDNIMKSSTDKMSGFKNNLTHHIIAGSRSGKGLMTLNMLTSALLSGKPIFYLDDKPDMASLMLQLCEDTFAINGGNTMYNKEDGIDYYKKFTGIEQKIKWGNIPEYVDKGITINRKNNRIGDIAYLRALLLVMGIIAARVDGSQINNLGGEQGIVAVVDETTNVTKSIRGILQNIFSKYMSNDTIEKARMANEKGKGKKPGEFVLWADAFTSALQSSYISLLALKNAGIENGEQLRSDIFMLYQEPDRLHNDVSTMVPQRSKGTEGLDGRYHKPELNIIESLPSIAGADAFIGYNKNIPQILDQGNPNSMAYSRLDANARNFAYLPKYGKDGIDELSRNRDNEVVYFKPFLILIEGREETPFVENCFRYADNSGVGRETVIKRNEDENNTGHLNPAVGFKEYLKRVGLSDGEIKEALEKSSNIAEYVVQQMGYKEGWFNFLYDLRPEWIFTVNDVVESVKSGQGFMQDINNRPYLQYIREFNPDMVRIGGRGGKGNGEEDIIDFFDDDIQQSAGEDKYKEYYDDDIINNIEDRQEYVDDFQVREDELLGVNVVDSDPRYGFDNQRIVEFTDEQGRRCWRFEDDTPIKSNRAGMSDHGIKGLEDIDMSGYGTIVDPVTQRRLLGVQRINGDKVEEGDRYRRSVLQNLSNEDLIDIIENMRDLQRRNTSKLNQLFGNIPEEITNSDHGEGKFRGSPGTGKGQYRNDIYQGDTIKRFTNEQKRFVESPQSLASVINVVTNTLIAQAGGIDQIYRIDIVGGSLVINGVMTYCPFSDGYLSTMPGDLAAEVRAGNLAKLFNFNKLYKMRNLEVLYFDSKEFVYSLVSEEMGWGNRVSVDLFFENLRRLQWLVINEYEFNRGNYQQLMRKYDVFYQPRKARKIYDAAYDLAGRGVNKGWSFAKNSMKNPKYNGFQKFLGATAGLVGGTASTVGQGGMKLGSKLASYIRRGFNSMGDVMKGE